MKLFYIHVWLPARSLPKTGSHHPEEWERCVWFVRRWWSSHQDQIEHGQDYIDQLDVIRKAVKDGSLLIDNRSDMRPVRPWSDSLEEADRIAGFLINDKREKAHV